MNPIGTEPLFDTIWNGRRSSSAAQRPCMFGASRTASPPSIHSAAMKSALRELRRQFPDSGFVFATERGGPFTTDAINRHIKRLGERAGFDFLVHCHMAPPRMRIRTGERRTRYQGHPGLAWTSLHPAHGSVHRAFAVAV
jgi:hypothetical protein